MKRDATVVLACRSMEKANLAISKIRNRYSSGKMIPLQLDLASFPSIVAFTNEIRESFDKVDCIIENAGLSLKGEHFTDDGFEVHFGVNYLGHFLLTNLLMDKIKQQSTRVVIVSSSLHENAEINIEQLGKYFPAKSSKNILYSNSKLANFYFGRELYKRGIDTHVLCPGLCYTDLFRSYQLKWYHYILIPPIAWWYLRSATQGAHNIVFSATESENSADVNPLNGFYVKNLKYHKSRHNFDDLISEQLWQKSLNFCKEPLKL